MLRTFIQDPVSLFIMLPAVILTLSFHEFAHAFTAVRLGDNTPKMTGRYTLNPLAHLDIFGFLCMLLTGFGWAKPVQINPRNFKRYKRGMAVTAVAGPLSNIFLSFICVLLTYVLNAFGLFSLYSGMDSFSGSFVDSLFTVISAIILNMSFLNLYLAVFNLLPIPPLDGSRIVSYLLPGKVAYYYDTYGQYFQIGLFAVMMVIIYADIFNPIKWVASEIYHVFDVFWYSIFA